jgi:uncharacterized membrane protein YfcA
MHYLYFVITGIITGFLMSLFGIGGGAFVVPALDIAFFTVPGESHPPFQIVILGSLAAIFIGSLPRAINTLKSSAEERFITFILLASAIPLIAICSFIAPHINELSLRVGFGVLIGFVGIWTLLGKTSSPNITIAAPINTTKIIFIGAVAGSSSAFFGLGGATPLTPLLSIWASLPMLMCINISLLFVTVTSFLSLLTLGYSWIYFHGLDNLTFTIASLIMLMGVTAAISQTLISRGLFRIKDSLRRKLLGFYLISLFFWMLYKALFL